MAPTSRAASVRRMRSAVTFAVAAALTLMFAPSAWAAPASPASLYAYVSGGPGGPPSCPQSSVAAARCTLTEALAAAHAGDTILLAEQATYTGGFHVSTAATSAGSPLVLEPAPGVTDPQLSGNFTNTVLTVDAGVFVALSGVSIVNGAGDFSSYDCGVGAFFTLGGGINNAGSLTVDDTSFVNNAGANFNGPADVGVGGGIYNSGKLTLTKSVLSGNTATQATIDGYGGGIYNAGTLSVRDTTFNDNLAQTGGGAIDNGDVISSCDFPATPGTGNVSISGSTFAGNRAATGGAIENTSAHAGSGQLSIDSSTFSDNGADTTAPTSILRFSTRSGGAVENINGDASITRSDFIANNASSGGAINDAAGGSGALTISTSTFSGNGKGAKGIPAQNGGAVHVGSTRSGKVSVTDSTFVSNAAANTGSAVDSADPTLAWSVTSATFRGNPNAIASAGPLSVAASLVVAGGCATPIVDAGYNVGDDSSCGFSSAQHSVSADAGIAADLGSFGAHGGPTPTIPISSAAADPANNAIPASFAAGGNAICSGTDQREQSRSDPCDIGAYETPPPGRSLYAYAVGSATNPLDCPQTTVLALRCSFSSALALAGPGDFIELATPGSQADPATWYVGSFQIAPVGGSTATAPLTVRAASGVDDPIFDGNDGRTAGCQTKFCFYAVLSVDPGSYVDFENFTIQDGGAGAGSLYTSATGCAISNDASNVTVRGMTFYSTGTQCASVIGEAVLSAARGGDGLGVLTVENSTFLSRNGSTPGTDVAGAGPITISSSNLLDHPTIYAVNAGQLTISKSAINGGVLADTLTAYDSTFTDSSGHAAAQVLSSGLITDSTFADNPGGAIASAGKVTLATDLLANSTGGSVNCDAAPIDAGYNISDDASCGFTAVGSVNAAAALDGYLTSLADHGGSTSTVALLPTSATPGQGPDPAHRAIPGSFVAPGATTAVCSLTDQRGVARVAPCDIGAYELMLATQSIAFTSTPPATPAVGDTYTVTATGGGSGNPVIFSVDGSSTPGACTVSAAGLVHFTGSGTCVVDADQAGDANYAAAPRVSQSVKVDKGPQAITFTSTPPAGATVGGTYQVTATGGPSGNPVTFTIDPSSTPGACRLSGVGLVQFISPGSCVIAANQNGDSNYTAAPRVSQTVAVGKDAQVITFTTTPPAGPVVGGSYQVRANGGVSGNPVVFTVDSSSTPGACTVAALGLVHFSGAGKCVVDADQAGNANYAAAPEVSQLLTVGKGSQAITFTTTPPVGPVVGATYQVSATGGGSGNPVTFTIDPSSTPGACAVSGLGLVSFTGAGSCVVDADQAGNADYTAAPENSQTVAVGKAAQAIKFTSTPPLVPVMGGSYQPAATGGPSGNPVTFTIDPSSRVGACAISGQGLVSFTGNGSCVIDADQSGNANYTAAPEISQTIEVGKVPQAITFTSTPPASAVVGASYQVTATGGGTTNPVTFRLDPSSTTGACTVTAAGLVSFTGAGSCVVDADQAGNADYAAAPEVSQSITVGKAAQAITFTSTPPAHPKVGQTYQVAASGGGSGNPVTFAADPATTPGACSVSTSGLVHFTGPGRCVIDANQAGNANYTAAPQVSQTVAVAAAPVTTKPPRPAPTTSGPGLLAFTGVHAFDLIVTATALVLLGSALCLILSGRRERTTPAEANRPRQ
jgi:large repetitive protein